MFFVLYCEEPEWKTEYEKMDLNTIRFTSTISFFNTKFSEVKQGMLSDFNYFQNSELFSLKIVFPDEVKDSELSAEEREFYDVFRSKLIMGKIGKGEYLWSNINTAGSFGLFYSRSMLTPYAPFHHSGKTIIEELKNGWVAGRFEGYVIYSDHLSSDTIRITNGTFRFENNFTLKD